MDRRTVLRTLGVGAVGISGCAGVQSPGSETNASETTTAGEMATTRNEETATTHDEETTTAKDDCPPAAVSDDRTHAHSDYGLGFIEEHEERPLVAVGGEDWRSKLLTDAMSEEDEAFLEETDFQQSVVLVVQYTKSSSGHELRLTDYEFDGETLSADLCIAGWKQIGPDDAPTTNLFARLDHSGTVPSTVEAQIDTGTETITVSSE